MQFNLRQVLLLFVALSVLLAASGWYYRTYVEPMHQARAVERRLHALATRRPADMSPRQGESAVAWTSNLHGNSLLPFQADGATIRRFEERLAEKLMAKCIWIRSIGSGMSTPDSAQEAPTTSGSAP